MNAHSNGKFGACHVGRQACFVDGVVAQTIEIEGEEDLIFLYIRETGHIYDIQGNFIGTNNADINSAAFVEEEELNLEL